jgi:hypothetical protein
MDEVEILPGLEESRRKAVRKSFDDLLDEVERRASLLCASCAYRDDDCDDCYVVRARFLRGNGDGYGPYFNFEEDDDD